jgi:starch synthase
MIGAMAGRRILQVSAEVDTLARTGGLGDVTLGLSRALAVRGDDVALVTPLYGNTRVPAGATFWSHPIHPRVGWGPADVHTSGVLEANVNGVRTLLVVNDALFGGRGGIYGDAHGTFGDNDLRFATLSSAALEIGGALWGRPPDVLHAHDWHTALAVIYAKTRYGHDWARVPSIISIHNMAYQGVLGFESLDRLGVPRQLFQPGFVEHGGAVNLLKGACALADRISTVSPQYAREILSEPTAFGLAGFLRARAQNLVGIVNGIDTDAWNPAHDRALVRTFSADDLDEGKGINKAALFAELDLWDSSAPLFACVSRLTWQKGIDLVLSVVPALVERGARVLVLGTGEGALESGVREMAARYPGRVAARISFDDGLARRIYAGADFVLVPSRFEPCGLTQLYSMRYGSIPVVTDVGGLHDTVEPYEAVREVGVGFVARAFDTLELLLACEEALAAYGDSTGLRALRRRAMTRDHSWTHAAGIYDQLLYDPLCAF